MNSANRTPIGIAVTGILLEAVALWLQGSKRVPEHVSTPLIIAGMLMAFVPLFVMARRSRRR